MMMCKMFFQTQASKINNADVEKDKQESVIEFLETLEDDDDVQNIFSNANFSNN